LALPAAVPCCHVEANKTQPCIIVPAADTHRTFPLSCKLTQPLAAALHAADWKRLTQPLGNPTQPMHTGGASAPCLQPLPTQHNPSMQQRTHWQRCWVCAFSWVQDKLAIGAAELTALHKLAGYCFHSTTRQDPHHREMQRTPQTQAGS